MAPPASAARWRQAFAAEGAHLVLADVEKPLLDATVEELADHAAASVTGVVTDVSDPASVEALAEAVFDRIGACHVLINNAGVGRALGEGLGHHPERLALGAHRQRLRCRLRHPGLRARG